MKGDIRKVKQSHKNNAYLQDICFINRTKLSTTFLSSFKCYTSNAINLKNAITFINFKSHTPKESHIFYGHIWRKKWSAIPYDINSHTSITFLLCLLLNEINIRSFSILAKKVPSRFILEFHVLKSQMIRKLLISFTSLCSYSQKVQKSKNQTMKMCI